MRCDVCATLTRDVLRCDGDPVPFHENFAAFEGATRAGCELCIALFWNIQKFRWGDNQRIVRYQELSNSSEPLSLRWHDMKRDINGHVIQGLDIVYRHTPGKRLAYSILQLPKEVQLPRKF
jgi:hypothetical protein